MKIAYIIIAHNNPIHLNRLVTAISSTDNDIYIHINKDVDINKFALANESNIYLIKERVSVTWVGFSFVQAVLNSLNYAKHTSSYSHYILLSGTDYPIKSNDYIYKFLTDTYGTEYINIVEMPGNGKTLDRLYHYYLGGKYNDSLFKKLILKAFNGFVKKMDIRRPLPKVLKTKILYGGSTWWALTDKCINYILGELEKDKSLLNFYKNLFIPDESMFHTLIANSEFKENITNSLTYSKWSSGKLEHPEMISFSDITTLATDEVITSYGKSKILFARKFNDNSGDLINVIDIELRKYFLFASNNKRYSIFHK